MAVTRFRPALLLVPIFLVGALWVAAAVWNGGRPETVVEVSGPIPTLAGPAVIGPEVDPSVYRGKVVVVNFWASWCPPCRREQPWLQGIQRDYGHSGVQVVGVNHRDGEADARSFVHRYGVTYPSVRDPAGILAPRFGVPYLPTTVLADASGRLRYRLIGEQDEETVRRLVEELLAEG
jgi:thiol-disulfide isomerase/thioredoxin